MRGRNHHNPKGTDPLRGAMPKLRIEGLERDLDVPKGANLNEACQKSHVNLFWSQWARMFNCRGIGLCGACPVRVLEGAEKLHAPTKKEVKRLRKRPEDFRLACQVKLEADLSIEPFPLKSIREELGKEPLRRALMEPEEREELFQKEREARLEARRVKVEEFLETRKKRRSKIVGFFMKRFKKDDSEEGEDKKKDGKKKGGGLAARLRKKDEGDEGAKKKPAKEKKEKKEKKAGGGEGKGKGGFKLGKRGKKKEAAEQEGGERGGE